MCEEIYEKYLYSEILGSDSVLPRQSLSRSDRDPPAGYAVLFPVYADCRGARHPRRLNAA